jgi:hypothetical protein
MPKIGPDGLHRYLPHEAYNAMGRHLFRDNWRDSFSGITLPHPPAAIALLASGDATEEQKAAIGDPTTENYHQRQSLTAHEQITFGRLIEALRLGKTDAWRKDADDQWTRIPYSEWQSGSDLCECLKGELLATLHEHQAPSETLWIETQRLDEFIAAQPVPEFGSYQPEAIRRGRGRPGLDWECIKAEFRRRNYRGVFPYRDGPPPAPLGTPLVRRRKAKRFILVCVRGIRSAAWQVEATNRVIHEEIA